MLAEQLLLGAHWLRSVYVGYMVTRCSPQSLCSAVLQGGKKPFYIYIKIYNILQQKISFLFSPSPKTGLSLAQLHSDGVLGWLNGWAVLGPLHMSICILGHCSTLESKCQLQKVPSHAGYLNVSWFSPSAFLSLPKLSLYLFHVGTGTSQALAVLFLFPRWRLGSAEARILVLGYKTEQGKGSALPKMFCMGKKKRLCTSSLIGECNIQIQNASLACFRLTEAEENPF